MFDKFSDGFCPECLLGDARTAMRLNHDDLWECPTCRLLAIGTQLFLIVQRSRGSGHIGSAQATKFVHGSVLMASREDDVNRGLPLGTAEQLRAFLAKVH